VQTLDAAGRHRWSPIAPCARAEVAFEHPALRWSGPAYLDTNEGDRPLETDFSFWHWCRAPLGDGAAVLYEVARRDGTGQALALRYAAAGGVIDAELPPPAELPRTRWLVPRPTRADGAARVVRTLEDAPFYSRSVLATRLCGEPVTAIHESLSLDRFAARWVQAMLPFRIPRRR
jgi:carotenoid 1,2-hydratase